MIKLNLGHPYEPCNENTKRQKGNINHKVVAMRNRTSKKIIYMFEMLQWRTSLQLEIKSFWHLAWIRGGGLVSVISWFLSSQLRWQLADLWCSDHRALTFGSWIQMWKISKTKTQNSLINIFCHCTTKTHNNLTKNKEIK